MARPLNGGCSARKIWRCKHLFDLRPMALAVARDQQQPLIAIQIAESAMGEEVLPRIAFRSGREIDGALAGRFEFAKKVVLLPSS